jgi:hypothetical protein
MKSESDFDFESLYRYVSENKLKIYDGWIERNISEILLNLNEKHMPEAEDWIKKAIKTHKINGMKWHLGRDYELYARILRRKGDQTQSKKKLRKAIDILKECGADGWVAKYEKELENLK